MGKSYRSEVAISWGITDRAGTFVALRNCFRLSGVLMTSQVFLICLGRGYPMGLSTNYLLRNQVPPYTRSMVMIGGQTNVFYWMGIM